MRFYREKSFKKDYQKLPQHIQKKLNKQLRNLAVHGVTHSGLNARKMEGYDIWEARIDGQYRLTFVMRGEEIFLRRAGTHAVYRKP